VVPIVTFEFSMSSWCWRTRGGASSISTSPPTPARNGRHNRLSRRFLGIMCPVISCGIAMRFMGSSFRARVRGMGVRELRTAPQSPWQNPYAERLIGSIRRECLDHVIVFNESSLRRLLNLYFHILPALAHSPGARQRLSCITPPFSLRSSVPYSNFLKSVDSITGTSGQTA
jgi:hypothetical protein